MGKPEDIPSGLAVDCMEVSLIKGPAIDKWKQSICRCIESIVAVSTNQHCDFDTDTAGTHHATAFIVARGLLLTNRHVLGCGPVSARGSFHGCRGHDIPLRCLYRDPVHDFGFYEFDPHAVDGPVGNPLSLNPRGALVGTEIRVIGNNANEKVSILAGTIARVDRPAPQYGDDQYSDFNSFYIQAATSSSCGSSGSPVVNIDGEVVALNAGSSTSSSASYFFPLARVCRALACLLHTGTVPRGSLIAQFQPLTMKQARRLDLCERIEKVRLRSFPDSGHILAVKSVLSTFARDIEDFCALEEGDILISVNDRLIEEFVDLEDILDSSIGQIVAVMVQRGRQLKKLILRVRDLESVTATELFRFGGGVFHNLSFGMACFHHLSNRHVFVADPGFIFGNAGIPRLSVITAVQGNEILDLNSFIRAVSCSSGPISVKYRVLANYTQLHVARVSLLSAPIFPIELMQRQPGHWTTIQKFSVNIADDNPPLDVDSMINYGGLPSDDFSNACKNMVKVTCEIPIPVEGIQSGVRKGLGFLIDVSRAILVVSRMVVPTKASFVQVTFFDFSNAGAHVVLMHPKYPIVLIKLDRGDDIPPAIYQHNNISGSDCYFPEYLFDVPLQLIESPSITEIFVRTVICESVKDLNFDPSSFAQFRPLNLPVLDLDYSVSHSGILICEDGLVCGMVLPVAEGEKDFRFIALPWTVIMAALDLLSCTDNTFYHFEMEFRTISLEQANLYGLPKHWIQRLSKRNTSRTALQVSNTFLTTLSSELIDGAILLAIDENVVVSFEELTTIEYNLRCEECSIFVWQDGREQQVDVKLIPNNAECVNNAMELVGWNGLTMESPSRETLRQTLKLKELLPPQIRGHEAISKLPYISSVSKGSPADVAGLKAGWYILKMADTWLSTDYYHDIFPTNLMKILQSEIQRGHQQISVQVMNRKGHKFWTSIELDQNDNFQSAWQITINGGSLSTANINRNPLQ